MPDIFGEDIAGKINDALGELVFPLTLKRETYSARNSTNPTQRTKSTRTYSGRGFVDDYEARHVDGTIIRRGDRKVIVLGASLPSGIVPKPNDEITIESETRLVINVMRDPAGATYECQVR